LACPWANGSLAALHLKGLEDTISWSTTKPEWGPVNEEGRMSWVFDETENTELAKAIDPVNGLASMCEVYQKACPGYNTRFTVPVLWDKKNEYDCQQ